MKRMMKKISVSGLAVVTVILISGCGATPTPRVYYPQKTIFSNGVTYNPTWDGYNECYGYNDQANAKCYLKDSNGTSSEVVKVLEPDFWVTLDSFIEKYTSSDELCKTVEKLQLIPGYSCTSTVREQLLRKGYYKKAYNWRLIDKDTARTGMLKRGEIIEAYQEGLIDKSTADLYLQKQSIDAAQRQVKASQDQADAARRAASAAEDAQFYQQFPLRKYY